MNQEHIFIPACLLIYAAVLVWLAKRDAREASSGYMIAGRQVGVFATMASIAGNLRDGAGLAAWVVLGIYFGFGALWLTLGLCTALAVLAVIAPRVRKIAEERDYISVQQLLNDNIGPLSARLSTWIIAGTALLYAAAQVYISGSLFASALAFPSWAGIAAVCAVVGGYLLLGGYYTTIRTGIVQWCVIMVIVVLPWLISSGGPLVVPLDTITSPGLVTASAFFGISFVVVFASADLWQLIFSAKSPASARAGMAWTIPVYIAICLGLIFFAKAVQLALPSTTKPEQAFFELFASGVMPEWIGAIVVLFVIASVMSTLDSQVFLFASTVVRGGLPTTVATDSPRMKSASQMVLAATMFILGLIAATIGNIVEFLFSAVTLGTVLAAPLALTVFRPNLRAGGIDRGIVCSLLVASLTYIFMFTKGMFANLAFTLVPPAVSAVGCLVALAFQRVRRDGNQAR